MKKTRSFNGLEDPEINNQTKTVEIRRAGLANALKRAESPEPAAVRNPIPPTNLVVSTGRIKFNKLGEARKDVQV